MLGLEFIIVGCLWVLVGLICFTLGDLYLVYTSCCSLGLVLGFLWWSGWLCYTWWFGVVGRALLCSLFVGFEYWRWCFDYADCGWFKVSCGF